MLRLVSAVSAGSVGSLTVLEAYTAGQAPTGDPGRVSVAATPGRWVFDQPFNPPGRFP